MKPRQHPSLVLKCSTWDHVEAFYTRKVKEGGVLSARVPFHPAPGEVITLALELPDQLVIAIDAEVEEAVPAPDGKKSAVRLRTIGLTRQVRGRLEALVAEARRERDEGRPGRRRSPSSSPPPARGAAPAEVGPPPPLPTDAPVDELVEPLPAPSADQVVEQDREVFRELERELRRMREVAAHEVLDVRWDATVDEIRRGYFALTRRLHPDVLARYRSPAIQQMAAEVFIQINRAYDRMRDAAVAGGGAIAAGPDLLPHRGWLAGFDDLGDARRSPAPGLAAGTPAGIGPPPTAFGDDGLFDDVGAATPPAQIGGMADPARSRATSESDAGHRAAGTTARPVGEMMIEARALMADGAWGLAREILAESLRRDPRNRSGRALYHLASAEALLVAGKPVEARTQLEVALAHDPGLEEARAAMERMRQDNPRRTGSILRRLFK